MLMRWDGIENDLRLGLSSGVDHRLGYEDYIRISTHLRTMQVVVRIQNV